MIILNLSLFYLIFLKNAQGSQNTPQDCCLSCIVNLDKIFLPLENQIPEEILNEKIGIQNINFNNKIYTLAMNGQTGKFIGNLPISWKSVLKFWSIVFLASSLISIIFGLLMTHNIF